MDERATPSRRTPARAWPDPMDADPGHARSASASRTKTPRRKARRGGKPPLGGFATLRETFLGRLSCQKNKIRDVCSAEERRARGARTGVRTMTWSSRAALLTIRFFAWLAMCRDALPICSVGEAGPERADYDSPGQRPRCSTLVGREAGPGSATPKALWPPAQGWSPWRPTLGSRATSISTPTGLCRLAFDRPNDRGKRRRNPVGVGGQRAR